MRRHLRAWYLAGALVAAIAAVGPPLDQLADDSFAWHMFQHMLILFLVPALLLLARPFTLFSSFAGKRATEITVRSTRALHVLAAPPVALAVFVGTLWLTHFTPLYELSLQHPAVHVAEHALYFVAGIFFWLPVLAPAPIRPPSYPLRLLYLLIALPQGALLGMAIGGARQPLYAHYVAAAGSLAAALADQRAAAAVMWLLGGTIVFAAFLATVGAWAHREAN